MNYAKPLKNKHVVFALVAASLLCMIVLTLNTNRDHTVLSGFYSPYDSFYASALSIFALPYSVGIFLLFKEREEFLCRSSLYPMVKKTGALCLGIYAIHILVLTTLDAHVHGGIVWDLALKPFVIFAVSAALTYFARLFVRYAKIVFKKFKYFAEPKG